MRVLLLHAERFSYTPTKKAVSQAEEVGGSYSAENALVAFTTVEEGDGEETLHKAADDIAEQAAKVKASVVVVYPYAHLSSNLAPLAEARSLLDRLSRLLEGRGLAVHKAPFGWYKAFEIKVHGHPIAELSRSYQPADRLPPLMEASRDFAPRLYGDYLARFGLKLGEKSAWVDHKWISAVEDIGSDLRLCEGPPLAVIFSRDILSEEVDGCAEYLFEGLAQPVRAYLPERGVVSSLDRLRSVLGGAELAVDDRFVWLQGRQFRLLLGVRLGSDRVLAMLNTTLAGLIATNVERLQAEQFTPLLPVKYSVVQAYVAVNAPTSSRFIAEAVGALRRRLKRVIVDDSDSKLAEKLRRAGMLWAPYTVIVGKREEETETVSIRFRSDGTTRVIPLGEIERYVAGAASPQEGPAQT